MVEGSKPARVDTLVMKFGGTSVGDADAIRQAAQIIHDSREDWPRVVAVTSAMSGVTNLLLEAAGQAVAGRTEFVHAAAEKLRMKHDVAADALLGNLAQRAQVKGEIGHLVATFTNLCQAIAVLGEATPRALDAVSGLGERMSVRLLAACVGELGGEAQYVEATQLIVTDSRHQDAHPDLDATRVQSLQVLEPLLAAGRVPVVTGYIAASSQGVLTTLGRGGSDYSAALLGWALEAAEVWIWTDVDGVMSADPRLVPEAHTIPELSYREIAELAYYGAKVVHPKTIRPVIEAGIPVRVCNTFNPKHPGTRLVDEAGENGSFKAVTAIRRQSLITVEGRGMLGVPGVAARTFGAVASTGTSVPLITQASSEQSICFAVPRESVEAVLSALTLAFERELSNRDIDRIWASEDVVIITVVGSGMRNTPGIAGQIFSALGECKLNVIAIAQGSSEVSISLVLDAEDAETGVRVLHDLIRH